MRAPLRPLPDSINRWTTYVGLLRWLDAAVAWLGCWILVGALIPDWPEGERIALAGLATIAAVLVPSLRVRWRPASAFVSLRVSRRLRPGDHAWYVRPGDARLVLVTARRRFRIVIAMPDQEANEGLSVRRTRVFVVPAFRA